MLQPSSVHYMTPRRLICLLLLPLIWSEIAFALDPGKDLSQLSHEVWLTENGLPQNTVHSLAQTADGYLWIGTEEGLARFDGVRFTVFDERNTPQLKSNYIKALLADRHGSLWIGTAEGLLRLLDGKFTEFTTNDGLPSNTIQAIYEDHKGDLWVATATGLGLLKGGAVTTFTTKERLISGSIQALFEDAEGTLWICTPYGLGQLKNGKFTNYTVRDGLGSNSVRSIQQDKSGRLWFATLSGLTSFAGGHFTNYTAQDGLPSDRIIALSADQDGSLLIGTANGLSRFKDNHFSGFTAADSLATSTILSLLQDREGNLWIGTETGGVSLLKDTKFTTFTTRNGLLSNLAKAIYEDHAGNIWIGTDGGGLGLLKDGRFTNFSTNDGLAGNAVLALYEDDGGTLWAGTPDGLSSFRDGRFVTYTSAGELANGVIRSIGGDHNGSLWVGTRGGLTRLRDGLSKTYTEADGLPNDFISAILSDSKGDVWVGTLGGLSRLRGEEFTTLTTRDGLSSDVITSLYEDADSTLWIGTNGGGLNRLKDGRITAYTTRQGLFDDAVYSILEDGHTNLWLSCRQGIFRINKKELDDFATGKTRSISQVVYGTADGMMTRECSGGGSPAGWKSRDGRLWFSTIRGVAMIDPERIEINQLPPPVVIEQIRIDDQSITPSERIELQPGATRLDFYYTAPSFVAPEKIRFKYKLEGFDKEWIDSGTRRVAYYTNLRPGNYRFQVVACNNDGVWSTTGASFGLYLKPYFYQTYWFYAVCLLVLAALAWQIYRLRVHRIEAQFRAVLAERTRIAREIHDNLAQEMLGISVQLEVVARTMPPQAEVARSNLDRVRLLVRHSIAEARRYVWDLRSQALDNKDLPTALTETARRLTLDTTVDAQVHVGGTFRPLARLVEDNLLRIAQEAINNAVKHADAKRVNVDLVFDARRVQLSVRDDGHGFDSQMATNGPVDHFGLVGMRERAAQIGGTLAIHSGNGSGTEIVVDVPISG
jgi:ligand-binding sensor domain-containing protein/signal transduction histidine kinase